MELFSHEKLQKLYDEYFDGNIVYDSKNESYYNISCGFDIETSSIEIDGEKIGFMYIWMFGFHLPDHENVVFYGRTWNEFIHMTESLRQVFNDGKLIIYVHNLDYEFQFIRKYFHWNKVFLMKNRKILYCESGNIVFKCSYRLSGKSLDRVGQDLLKYKSVKKVGDLDYDLIRNSKTPLSDQEMGYCENDIVVLTNFIQEKIDQEVYITKIPLTNTGYVRRFCREKFREDKKYISLMRKLTIETEEYELLKKTFQGGFTHSSMYHSGYIVEDVTSYDICSSYPSVMVCEKFPMSKGVKKNICSKEQFDYYRRNFCCIFSIKFEKLKSRNVPDHILSKSKCDNISGGEYDNGRVISCDSCVTYLTNIDYDMMSLFYTWDSIKIGDFYIYTMEYLPETFIKCILEFYQKKTELKDVEGREEDYQLFKSMQNSCYGMCVEDPVKENYLYINDEYIRGDDDIEGQISRYNLDKKRFLFYPWGIFVTSYARKNILMSILECGSDYIYSDTDSNKMKNGENHVDFFEKYNENVKKKMRVSSVFNHFDEYMTHPKTIQGVEKPLGVFEKDSHYDKFKTLGAKRYMYEKNGIISITIAGVGKKQGASFLSQFEDPFEKFSEDLVFDEENCGKLIHTYIDNPTTVEIVDYLGNICVQHEESSINLSKTTYKMTLSPDYNRLLYSLRVSLA